MKNQKFITLYLICIFEILSLIFNLNAAHAAQQTLRVSPVIINVSLSPGKVSEHKVTIENLTNTPLPLRGTLNDFLTSGEEGGYVFTETKDNPLLSWITLDQTEFLLNPKEKKTMLMRIKTPQRISLGGYYGILFFETVPQSPSSDTTRIAAKVGVLMLANIGVTDPKAKRAEILTFETGRFHQDGNLPVLLRVRNTSLNFFSAKPTVTAKPLIDNVIPNLSLKEVALEEKIIFPGKIRRWDEAAVLTDLPPNIYHVTMSVSSGNGQTVTKAQYIVVMPSTVFFFIGTIILIALLLLKKNRSRTKKATVLTGGS